MVTGATGKGWLIVRTENSETALEIGRSPLEELVNAVSQVYGKITGMEYAAMPAGEPDKPVIGKCGRDCSQCDCKTIRYKSGITDDNGHVEGIQHLNSEDRSV